MSEKQKRGLGREYPEVSVKYEDRAIRAGLWDGRDCHSGNPLFLLCIKDINLMGPRVSLSNILAPSEKQIQLISLTSAYTRRPGPNPPMMMTCACSIQPVSSAIEMLFFLH
eukprot:2522139-Rhodomonas_salina.2